MNMNFISNHTVYDAASQLSSRLDFMLQDQQAICLNSYSLCDIDSCTDEELMEVLQDFSSALFDLFKEYGDNSEGVRLTYSSAAEQVSYSDKVCFITHLGTQCQLALGIGNASGPLLTKDVKLVYFDSDDNMHEAISFTANVTVDGTVVTGITNPKINSFKPIVKLDDGSRCPIFDTEGNRISPAFLLAFAVENCEILSLLSTSIKAGLSGAITASDITSFISTFIDRNALEGEKSKQLYQQLVSSVTTGGLPGMLSEVSRQITTYQEDQGADRIEFAGAEPIVQAFNASAIWQIVTSVVTTVGTVVAYIISPILGIIAGMVSSLVSAFTTGVSDTAGSKYSVIWDSAINFGKDVDNRVCNVSCGKTKDQYHITFKSKANTLFNESRLFKSFAPGIETFFWYNTVTNGSNKLYEECSESFLSLDYSFTPNKRTTYPALSTNQIIGHKEAQFYLNLNACSEDKVNELIQTCYSPIPQGTKLTQSELQLRLCSSLLLYHLHLFSRTFKKDPNFNVGDLMIVAGDHGSAFKRPGSSYSLSYLFSAFTMWNYAYSKLNTSDMNAVDDDITDLLINGHLRGMQTLNADLSYISYNAISADVLYGAVQQGYIGVITESGQNVNYDNVTTIYVNGNQKVVDILYPGLFSAGSNDDISTIIEDYTIILGARSKTFFLELPTVLSSSVLRVLAIIGAVVLTAIIAYTVCKRTVNYATAKRRFNLKGRLDADYQALTSGSLNGTEFKTTYKRFRKNSLKYNLLARISGVPSYNQYTGMHNSSYVNPTGSNPGVDSKGNLIDGLTDLSNSTVIASMLGIQSNNPSLDTVIRLINSEYTV